jgi:peptidoglycan/xylan/chitin deacetylase (PgdA/CDA1 family)
MDIIPAVSTAFILCLLWILFNVFSIRYSLFLKSVCRIKTHEKVVFLSFDDGPSEQYTPLILSTLKEMNIKAIFFCIGHKSELNPELIKRISNEGHSIGNHTYSHKWQSSFYSNKKIESEISCTTQILNNISGQHITLFRPPFGITNPSVANALKVLDMLSVGWDIRSFDTISDDPQKLILRISRKLRSGSIILLHDNRKITSQILRDLIELIAKRGYKILPFPDLIKNA